MRILAIGNSFSDDSFAYLYEIIKSSGYSEDLYIANLFYGGCALAQHCDFFSQKSAVYEYRVNAGDGWKTKVESTYKDALLDGEWDIISFQQASGFSGKVESYAFLEQLMNKVKKEVAGNPTFVWNMTWAYSSSSDHPHFEWYNRSQENMYNAIINAVVEKIVSNNEIGKICPCGIAVQLARNNNIVKFGDELTRDGFHLDFVMGRFIAGLTVAKTLLEIDLDKVTFRTDGVSEEDFEIAKEVVNLAIQTKTELFKK